MTLTRHPSPWSIAQHLREIATLLEDNGRHDRAAAAAGRCRCLPCAAALLAARGWPTATGGDGTGSRGADTTSSTERAVGLAGNPDTPAHPPLAGFAFIDERLAKALYVLWQTGLRVQTDARNILAHAGKDDLLPAGSGECTRCGRFVRPDLKQGDRIRSGLCNACYCLWRRRGKPERSRFIREGGDVEAEAA